MNQDGLGKDGLGLYKWKMKQGWIVLVWMKNETRTYYASINEKRKKDGLGYYKQILTWTNWAGINKN